METAGPSRQAVAPLSRPFARPRDAPVADEAATAPSLRPAARVSKGTPRRPSRKEPRRRCDRALAANRRSGCCCARGVRLLLRSRRRRPRPPAETSTQFDPARTGDITGRVTWGGDVPVVPPFQASVQPLCEQARPEVRLAEPQRPRDRPAKSRPVAGAKVVFPWVRRSEAQRGPGTLTRRMSSVRLSDPHPPGRRGRRHRLRPPRGGRVELESKQALPSPFPVRGADLAAPDFPPRGDGGERILDRVGPRRTVEQRISVQDAPTCLWIYHLIMSHWPLTQREVLAAVRRCLATGDLVCWLPDQRRP